MGSSLPAGVNGGEYGIGATSTGIGIIPTPTGKEKNSTAPPRKVPEGGTAEGTPEGPDPARKRLETEERGLETRGGDSGETVGEQSAGRREKRERRALVEGQRGMDQKSEQEGVPEGEVQKKPVQMIGKAEPVQE